MGKERPRTLGTCASMTVRWSYNWKRFHLAEGALIGEQYEGREALPTVHCPVANKCDHGSRQ